MNARSDDPAQTATLPELEHLLVRAARRRAAPSFGRRRWALAVAAASLVLAAGAAAATGVFQIAGGQTSNGTFSIESRVVSPSEPGAPQSTICLQLHLSDRGTAYGCGDRPSTAEPFGLVIADALDNGNQRVVYGLVSSDISRVIVLGGGGSEADVDTNEKSGLPGRFFSAVVPSDERLELIGYGANGEELARVGGLEPQATAPLSKAEAMAEGEPGGFAPTGEAPTSYIYRGASIDASVATRLELTCLEGRDVIRCFDSVKEMEAVQGMAPTALKLAS